VRLRRLLAQFLGSALLAAVVTGSAIAAERVSPHKLVGGVAATAPLRMLHPDVTPAQAADVAIPRDQSRQ
jgi:hypothetical protein